MQSDDTENALTWHLVQCFGGDSSPGVEVPHADIVSTCAFDPSGNYLAAGDNGGRIVVWEKKATNPVRARRSRAHKAPLDFAFFCEFQSHDPEFDCLKSTEIPERINSLSFLNRKAGACFLLAANDKTIKLWKVYERDFKVLAPNMDDAMDVGDSGESVDLVGPELASKIRIPRIEVAERATVAKPRGRYTNAHSFNIHSVHPSCEGETFLSADDLRVNIWDINYTNITTNVLDIRPSNMDDLNEVITSTHFHPSQCGLFMYSTSLGSSHLCDLRVNLDCSRSVKTFKYQEPRPTPFTDIISSISSSQFGGPDGRYLFCRDYMTVKIWDTHMERAPVSILRIHDHIRSQLALLYENECVFDKFSCSPSPDGTHVLTGSYSNTFQILSRDGSDRTLVEATTKRKKSRPLNAPITPPSLPDFDRKCLHVAWHPIHNLTALCTSNNLFIYAGVPASLTSSTSSLTAGGHGTGGEPNPIRDMA
eukprot:c15675_g1_i4.p1 GENE.c15675_g1_i4~~c15675_g1_i4.p1  ORF type:complete len:479 (+),score=78.15 c15675_g1_i4:129-1565(+)